VIKSNILPIKKRKQP